MHYCCFNTYYTQTSGSQIPTMVHTHICLGYQISVFLLFLICLNLISKVCLLHYQKWLYIQVFNQLVYLLGLTINLLTYIDDSSFSCPGIISSTHLFSISLLSYLTVSYEQHNRALQAHKEWYKLISTFYDRNQSPPMSSFSLDNKPYENIHFLLY